LAKTNGIAQEEQSIKRELSLGLGKKWVKKKKTKMCNHGGEKGLQNDWWCHSSRKAVGKERKAREDEPWGGFILLSKSGMGGGVLKVSWGALYSKGEMTWRVELGGGGKSELKLELDCGLTKRRMDETARRSCPVRIGFTLLVQMGKGAEDQTNGRGGGGERVWAKELPF